MGQIAITSPLLFHELHNRSTNGDEIHTSRQRRNVNLLIFTTQTTRLDDLAHQIHNAIFGLSL